MTLSDKTKIIQRAVGVKDDSIYGNNTADAIIRELKIPLDENTLAYLPSGTKVDERSEKNIATLLPEAQPVARALVKKAADAGLTIKVISGNRTYAEQDALYTKGRTSPGPKVTNARGGYSNHNFGIAFDIGVFKNGDYLEDGPEYKSVGQFGKSLGLKWGGDWTSFKDYPHFEYNPKNYTTAQLRERKAQGLPLV